MSRWRKFTRGIRALAGPDARARDLRDEVGHYFEEAAAAFEADGLSPEEARRQARLQLGTTLATREQVQESGWEHAVETLFADLRHAVRRLRATPGFTIVGIAIVALGIGAATAVFSLLHSVLIERLPYPDPERLAMVWDYGPDGAPQDVTFGTYREIVERSRSFEAAAVMRPWQATFSGGAEPERLDGQRVSAEYFDTLGVRPFLGRNFEEHDDRPGAPAVVIVSDGLWRRRFAADPALIGRTLALDGVTYTVIGVMPRAFENVLASSSDIWRPLRYDPALPLEGPEWGHHLRMVVRLRPAVAAARASKELSDIAHAPIEAFARPRWASLESGLLVYSLHADLTRNARPALIAVFAAVLLLLAIACVNVTNLFIARGARRRGELALRTALGGRRARLVRHLLAESLLLAFAGGAGGMLLAAFGLQLLIALVPTDLPRVNAVAMSVPVYAFAFGITMLVGVVAAIVPALQMPEGELLLGIQHGSSRVAPASGTLRSLLVVAEVALVVVLLVGTGLLLRTMQRLLAVDPGFDASGLLSMQVQTSGPRFSDPDAVHRFYDAALQSVERVPGVAAATWTSQLPLTGDEDIYGVHFTSNPAASTAEDLGAFRYAVTPGYFEAMGIPLRKGRLLDAGDTARAPAVVVINESFERRRFPGQDPLGQRVHFGPTSGPPFTIVGVVGDVRQTSLALRPPDAVYTTAAQWHFADNARWLVVRARVEDETKLLPAIRRAIWDVDPDQPIVRIARMSNRLEASVAQQRFGLLLFQVFGASALLLAAVGIYGVLAGTVAERFHEIGVRAALGASRREIVGMVVRQGMNFTCIGAAIGLVGAIAATGLLRTMLFEVSRLDAAAYVSAVAVVAMVAVLACALPAWRASRIDPSRALRAE